MFLYVDLIQIKLLASLYSNFFFQTPFIECGLSVSSNLVFVRCKNSTLCQLYISLCAFSYLEHKYKWLGRIWLDFYLLPAFAIYEFLISVWFLSVLNVMRCNILLTLLCYHVPVNKFSPKESYCQDYIRTSFSIQLLLSAGLVVFSSTLVFAGCAKFNTLSTVHFYDVLFDSLNTTANDQEESNWISIFDQLLAFLNFQY